MTAAILLCRPGTYAAYVPGPGGVPETGYVEGYASLSLDPSDWLQTAHNGIVGGGRSQLPPLHPYHGAQAGLKRPFFHWPSVNEYNSAADDAKVYTVETRNRATAAAIDSFTSATGWTYARATVDHPLGTWCQWRVNDPVAGWSEWRDFYVRADAITYACPTRTGAQADAAAKARPRFGLSAAQIDAYTSGDQVASFNRMKVLFDNDGAGGGGSFAGGALPSNTPSTATALLEHTRMLICQHLWQITGTAKYQTEGLRRYVNLLGFSAANIASMTYEDTKRISDITLAIAYDTWGTLLTTPQLTLDYDLAGASMAALQAYPITNSVSPSSYGRRLWHLCLFAGHMQNHVLSCAVAACARAGDEALFTGGHSGLAANITAFMQAVEVLQAGFEFKGTDDGGYRGGPQYAASQSLFVAASDAMAACFSTPYWSHPKRFQLERNKALLYPKSISRYDGFGDDNQVAYSSGRFTLGWRARAQEMHELIESAGLAMDDGQYYSQALFYRSPDAAPARGVPTKLTHWVLNSGEFSSHSAWADTARTSLFARSDPNGSFNHSNLRNNAVIIKVGGQPVAVDGGRYDDFSTTHQFNFRGLAHKAGNQVSLNSRAGGYIGNQGNNSSRSARARFIKVQDGGADWGAFTSEAAQSYQMTGYEHTKARRSVFHLRPGLFLFVDDHALSGSPQPFEVNWHSENLHQLTGFTVASGVISGTVAAGHGVPVGTPVQAMVSTARTKPTSVVVSSNVATWTTTGGHNLPLGSVVPVIVSPIQFSGWPAGAAGYVNANVSSSTVCTFPTTGIADGPITIPGLGSEPGIEFSASCVTTIGSGTTFAATLSGATLSNQTLTATSYALFGPSSAGPTAPLVLSQGTNQLTITPLTGAGLTTPSAQLLDDFSWGGANNTQLAAKFCNASVHKFGQQHFHSTTLQQNHAYKQYPSGTTMLAACYGVATGQTAPSGMACSATAGAVTFTFSVGGTAYTVTLDRSTGEWGVLEA